MNLHMISIFHYNINYIHKALQGAPPDVAPCNEEGRCKATWKREFNLPWRKAGPPNHHGDKVDSEQ